VFHSDGKGVVEEYFQKTGVPTTLPFYCENFPSIFKPWKVPQGTFVLGKMGPRTFQVTVL